MMLRAWVVLVAVMMLEMYSSLSIAMPDKETIVAPGLWRVVTHVYGPMQAQRIVTTEECWNARTSSFTAFIPNIGNHSVIGEQGRVHNLDGRTIVQLSATQSFPGGSATEDNQLIFRKDHSVLHRATLEGTGYLRFSATPLLDDHYTQRGYWLSANCPATLPPPASQILHPTGVFPGIKRLQALSEQLQAKYPQASH